MKIFCVSAFPERRNTIDAELRLQGVSAEYIDAPVGMAAALDGWMPSPTWREPNLKRLTTWGELACFAGHYLAWEQVAETPGGALIIEDDAKILAPLEFSPRGDLVYLGGKFMRDPAPARDGLIPAPYTYWTVAYWLSQLGARKLGEACRRKHVIAPDEYIPYHFGANPNVTPRHRQAPPAMLAAWAVPKWLVSPSGRWPSATENSKPAFELRTSFFATNPLKADRLRRSLDDHGYCYDMLMQGDPDWDTSGPGGGRKIGALFDWLNGLDQLRARAVALVLDGYDTLPLVGPDNILLRYGEMLAQIVIGGELNCWPEESLREPLMAYAGDGWPGETSKDTAIYHFPCSGTVIGMASDLRDEIAECRPLDDDQLTVQERILEKNDKQTWLVDREAYIFQSLAGAADHVERSDGWVRNTKTNCYPALLHDNGPASSLDRCIPVDAPSFAEDPKIGEWLEVAPDIIGMPFLTPECCAEIASSAEESGPWEPLPDDNVPGDELRMRVWDASRATQFAGLLKTHLAPTVESHWRPAFWQSPSDVFFIRYSASGQAGLRLHEDKSYLSCSIKLVGACAGGQLWFPRQNFNDSLIPSGWLLMWPSRITHPHQVLPATKGRRLSIVVWTGE